MAAIAPITILDGKATPVSHIFNPIQTNPPVYHENGNPVIPLVGENEITLALKKSNGAISKAVVTLRVPVLEVQSGSSYAGYEAPPKVAYYASEYRVLPSIAKHPGATQRSPSSLGEPC